MARPTTELDALLEALRAAVSAGDAEGLAALMTEGVTWTFSGVPLPVRGRPAVMATWSDHLARWGDVTIRRRGTGVEVRGAVAWGSFLWDGEGSAGPDRYRLEGERWSFVAVREGGAWRLDHVHSSMPYRDWASHRVEGR